MIDAKVFIQEYKRMCHYYSRVRKNCKECPASNNEGYCSGVQFPDDDTIDKIDKWVKDNPVKTRQSEFLKIFPNAKMWDDKGFLSVCPKTLDTKEGCSSTCFDCCKKYWNEVVE